MDNTINLEELKRNQLEMLKDIHVFCENTNICYSLAYGSLIGAIRHKGFIPWDDDIDIWMLRKDYEKFIKTFNDRNSIYRVICPEIDSNFYAPYANVYDTRTILEEYVESHRGFDLGIKIDLFPLDYVPNDEKKYRFLSLRAKLLNSILASKNARIARLNGLSPKITCLIKKIIYSVLSVSFANKKLLDIVSQLNKPQDYIDNFVFQVYPNRKLKTDWFNEFILVDFEDYKFMVPKGYDLILKTIYGDYLKLPPENKRVPHHGFTAYWKRNNQ